MNIDHDSATQTVREYLEQTLADFARAPSARNYNRAQAAMRVWQDVDTANQERAERARKIDRAAFVAAIKAPIVQD